MKTHFLLDKMAEAGNHQLGDEDDALHLVRRASLLDVTDRTSFVHMRPENVRAVTWPEFSS